MDKLSLAFIQVILLNSVKLLKVLIQYGVDVNGTDCMFEENGIMHAARYGHEEMLLFLIQSGVGINHQSESGSTAIHVAVENGKLNCLKLLVQQKGVDLNIQDCSGYSPLLWTARLRDWRAMQVLVDAGCKIESTDYCKRVNALHVCVDLDRAFWKGKNATPHDTMKCIDVLIEAGVDINKGENYGIPPIVYAVKSNNVPAVKHLLKLNCDLECKRSPSCEGQNTGSYVFKSDLIVRDSRLLPLYFAISKFNFQIVKILCYSGVKYHKLAQEPEVMTYAREKYGPMYALLNDLVFNPMSLKMASRNVIRRAMGTPILKQIDKLELPTVLKGYLMLDDLDQM